MSDLKADHMNAYAVLLAGGSGTRLWPVSREFYPKQLARLVEKDSLIQGTIRRLEGFMEPRRIRIVCGRSHYEQTARHAAACGLDPDQAIICEPCGRNTAPAILLATLSIMQHRPRCVLFVLPADHVIDHKTRFHQQLRNAHRLAQERHIVTFGIQPDYPETGYGYIEGAKNGPKPALAIKRFVEKPDRKTAETYLARGGFFWNSGMFAFRSDVILEEFEHLAPQMTTALKSLVGRGDRIRRSEYEALAAAPFDVTVMEKTAKGVVLPSDFGWSDIGSWKALYDFLPKDKDRNVLHGDVVVRETCGSLVMGRHRLVAVNGLEDMAVIETPDAVFVSDLQRSRDVKAIVEALQRDNRREHRLYPIEHLPWGTRHTLDERPEQDIVRLTVNNGASLKQRVRRGDCWYLMAVAGCGELILDGTVSHLESGTAKAIRGPVALGLSNPGKVDLTVILVRSRFKGPGEAGF